MPIRTLALPCTRLHWIKLPTIWRTYSSLAIMFGSASFIVASGRSKFATVTISRNLFGGILQQMAKLRERRASGSDLDLAQLFADRRHAGGDALRDGVFMDHFGPAADAAEH